MGPKLKGTIDGDNAHNHNFAVHNVSKNGKKGVGYSHGYIDIGPTVGSGKLREVQPPTTPLWNAAMT